MKKEINKYWLTVNKQHRDLKWMSHDDWDPEISELITASVESTKKLLDALTKIVEEK